jgi:hypothetical protein
MLGVVILSAITGQYQVFKFIKFRYAECRYTECRYAE